VIAKSSQRPPLHEGRHRLKDVPEITDEVEEAARRSVLGALDVVLFGY
jgi:hypothetical protein